MMKTYRSVVIFINILLLGNGLPEQPVLGNKIHCNALVGVWRKNFNLRFTGDRETHAGIYVVYSEDPKAKQMAVLWKDGQPDENRFFGYNTRNSKYQFRRRFSVAPKYENGEGNWCMVWNVNDRGYIYDDTSEEESPQPLGFLVKISDEEKDFYIHQSTEEIQRAWAYEYNNYGRDEGEFPPVGIAKRSKGCYFTMVIFEHYPRDNFAAKELLGETPNLWGLYNDSELDYFFTDPENLVFSKLRWDAETEELVRDVSTAEARVVWWYGTTFRFTGSVFRPVGDYYIPLNPCDTEFTGPIYFTYIDAEAFGPYTVGTYSPVKDSEAQRYGKESIVLQYM